MRLLFRAFAALSLLGASLPAAAQSAQLSGGSGFRLIGRGFIYSIESEQNGDDIDAGSAAVTRYDAQYRTGYYGASVGLASGLDSYGADQLGVSLALTGEFEIGHLFLDFGYGIIRETFKNRAIKTRNGTLLTFYPGFRDQIFFPWLFYDVGLEWRQLTLTQEDGHALDHPIHTKEILPLGGFGVTL